MIRLTTFLESESYGEEEFTEDDLRGLPELLAQVERLVRKAHRQTGEDGEPRTVGIHIEEIPEEIP